MADAIGSLGLDTKEFEKGIDRVSSKLDSLKKPIGALDTSVNLLGSSLGKLAAFFSVGALTSYVKSIIDLGGALKDQAETLNINVETLQEFNHAFGQSGAKAEDVTNSIVKLNQSLQDARDNTGSARKSFEALGITWDEIANGSPDEILLKIADGSKDATDKVEALNAIVDLLGKSGKKMAAGMGEGADGIKRVGDEAKKLTEQQIDMLDKLGDRWDTFVKNQKVKWGSALTDLYIPGIIGKPKKENDAQKMADLFAKQPLPGRSDYDDSPKDAPPEDPLVAAEALSRQQEAAARVIEQKKKGIAKLEKEMAENNKKWTDEADDARKEEEEDNAHLLEQERERNKNAAARLEIAKELAALNAKAAHDEQTTENIQAMRQRGDYAGADATRVRKDFADKTISAKERGATQAELDAIRAQEQNALRDVNAAAAAQTPADRRAQRNEERRTDRLNRAWGAREKDREERAKREFERDPKTNEPLKDEKGRIVPKKGRSQELDDWKKRRDEKDKIDKPVDAAKQKDFKGFSQEDSKNIESIAKALSNENKK